MVYDAETGREETLHKLAEGAPYAIEGDDRAVYLGKCVKGYVERYDPGTVTWENYGCLVHPSSFWSVMLLLQAAFYGLAALGFLAEQFDWQFPLVHLPYQFTLQHAVAFSAVVSYLKVQRVAKWIPLR